MSDAWRLSTIESFEQVAVAPSTALLRVSARSAHREGDGTGEGDGPRPVLVADDGHTVDHFAAIPAPADRDDLLRAAYSVPESVVTPETVFSLEFADGFVIALPEPTPGPARLNRPRVGPARPADELADVTETAVEPVDVAESDEWEERRSELQAKVTELSEELGRTRFQSTELRALAEAARTQTHHAHLQAAESRAELQALRDLAAAAPGPKRDSDVIGDGDADADADAASLAELEHRETAARLSELETWSGELERRLADTTTQLADARGLTQSDEAELRRLRGELAEAQAQNELDRARTAASDEAHEQARRDLADLAAPGDPPVS